MADMLVISQSPSPRSAFSLADLPGLCRIIQLRRGVPLPQAVDWRGLECDQRLGSCVKGDLQ